MLTGWRLSLSKCFIIPQRYVLGIMGFLAVVNAYNMRVCLSVTITEMTGKDGKPWDKETQGIILSSFYWGYVITHMPGGILAEYFGGKYTLGIGMLGTAIFTLLTPIVVHYGDWQWFLALRVIEGLGEGTTYPALNALLSQWVPQNERAKIGTLVYAGGQIGSIVGNVFSGVLVTATGGSWESVFYVFGGLGVLWFILWTLMCYSRPDDHPFISDKEKNYLEKEIGANAIKKEDMKIPWIPILTSVPLWALIAAQIGHDWGFFIMVTDLPTYMKDILEYDIQSNGIISSLPYLVMWFVSMFSAWLCDYLIGRNKITITFARKFFTTVASVGPAVFLIAATYAGKNEPAVVTLFCIGMGLMGTFYPGMKVNALDLASNYAGTLMAIVNGIGAITGIITPILIGYIASNGELSEWQTVFWISFGVFMVTNIIFVVFGSAEEQWWNTPGKLNPKYGENSDSKNNTISIVNNSNFDDTNKEKPTLNVYNVYNLELHDTNPNSVQK